MIVLYNQNTENFWPVIVLFVFITSNNPSQIFFTRTFEAMHDNISFQTMRKMNKLNRHVIWFYLRFATTEVGSTWSALTSTSTVSVHGHQGSTFIVGIECGMFVVKVKCLKARWAVEIEHVKIHLIHMPGFFYNVRK